MSQAQEESGRRSMLRRMRKDHKEIEKSGGQSYGEKNLTPQVWSRRQRSRSHSGSCESSHRFLERSGKDHRAQKSSRQSRSGERTRKTSPIHKSEKRDHNLVWKQLKQISQSPFSSKIERAKRPIKFTPSNLISYNGKTDPVAHLSHYKQSMALYNGNDALICRIFPSSLGEVTLRWFDRLEHGSIHSWKELSEEFTTRFITNSRKPKEVDSLMALTMKPGKSLKSYSARYWKTYNEIDLCGEDLSVRQFNSCLPIGCKIRQSLTKKPPLNMTDLMSRIEQHVRVEEDRLQPQKKPDNSISAPKKSAQPETSKVQRKTRQPKPVTKESFEAINTTFKEPMFKILPQIKDKPYFVWPVKMDGDPASKESKPYCAYHREKGSPDQELQELQRVFRGAVIHSHARAADLKAETRTAAHLQEVFQVSKGATPAPKRLRKPRRRSSSLITTLKGSAEIMYDSLFKGLGLGHEDLDRKADPLYRFSSESIMPIGRVTVKALAAQNESRPVYITSKAEISNFRGDHRNQGPYEALGVNPAFACHSLNVDPLSRPVVQKGQRTSPLHEEAVCEEVNWLIEAGAIKEILYPTWLSNTVVVKKKNKKWRVCINFTDLNKACPKDPFPLLKIDQLVDVTAGHQRMSFLAFQGYHQIAMNLADQEKMAFITLKGIFFYKVKPFKLKNAGATYQRMITKMFEGQLGKTVEVYIDNMVVKSIFAEDHLGDLRAVFNILRLHCLKLNASKCAFGVGSRKFLGFMATQRGIEANLDQITAILNLKPPRTVREVQRLTGMTAALNCFISRLAEKCRPFFDLIKKSKSFQWGDQSD
uniref:Reverse transcriptase domain-containing protein n=1 Tax=Fagus sylvatica TaxID=28930 RepID=A0A2N9H8Y8_FAGSY